MSQTTLEKRLRRAIARGAGSDEIKRLLKVVQAQERSRGMASCLFYREKGQEDDAPRWAARIAEAKLATIKGRDDMRFMLSFHIEGRLYPHGGIEALKHFDIPDCNAEAIYACQTTGPLGLDVSLRSTMHALAPDVLQRIDETGEYVFYPEDLVGKRADITVHSYVNGSKHWHFVSSIRAIRPTLTT